MNLKTNLFQKPNSEVARIPYNEDSVELKIAMQIVSMLPSTERPIIIFCIGTDRSTGDSLGPLIGTKLTDLGLSHFHIYGTLDEPIHAVNLLEKIAEVHRTYKDPFIIGIDACLGRVKSVGVITIADGPIKPGAGVNKELTPVGDMHITGIVNVSGFMEFFVLQNTRLSLVMKIATSIASGIYQSERLYYRKRELFLNQLEERNQ